MATHTQVIARKLQVFNHKWVSYVTRFRPGATCVGTCCTSKEDRNSQAVDESRTGAFCGRRHHLRASAPQPPVASLGPGLRELQAAAAARRDAARVRDPFALHLVRQP